MTITTPGILVMNTMLIMQNISVNMDGEQLYSHHGAYQTHCCGALDSWVNEVEPECIDVPEGP